MSRSTGSAAAAVALLVAGCSDMAPMQQVRGDGLEVGDDVFRHEHGFREGRRFRRRSPAPTGIARSLAAAAAPGSHTWHAYLSTQGPGAVNARDRIGKGPWRNAKGVVIANERCRTAWQQQHDESRPTSPKRATW